MDRKIKELEELAKRKAELRKEFSADRDQQQARRERLEKEALPIVKPIVEAIKTEQSLILRSWLKARRQDSWNK